MLEHEGFETTTEVLIVGAGPVGMTLHLALRTLGIDSVLVDKHAAGLNTSRAAVIHARTLEVLEPFGVVPTLLSRGIRTADFRVREADRVLLHIGFKDLPSNHPYALMCPQDQTESVLRVRLQELGLRVERPVDFVSASDSGESIAAELADAEGRTRRVTARWLVGCDGARSAVRASVGIGFEGDDYVETFVLADVRMDFPLARDEVSLFFSTAIASSQRWSIPKESLRCPRSRPCSTRVVRHERPPGCLICSGVPTTPAFRTPSPWPSRFARPCDGAIAMRWSSGSPNARRWRTTWCA